MTQVLLFATDNQNKVKELQKAFENIDYLVNLKMVSDGVLLEIVK